MQRFLATKGRLYPNKTTEAKINQNLNNCRYIYNYMLNRSQKVYKRRGEHMLYIDMQNLLPKMKKYMPWLAETDAQALKYACRQLDTAYRKFFKHEAGFPNFHKKHGRQSYTTTANKSIHINDNNKKIKIPTLGWVNVRGLRHLPENSAICYATISREPDGRYYISVTYKIEVPDVDIQQISTSKKIATIGLDYKSDGLYVDSDGICANMPHYYQKAQIRLAKAQKILSRRNGSKNGEKKSSGWKKQNQKINIIYRKIKNQRRDYLNKKSRDLADKYDYIFVENLNMKDLSNKGFGNGKATLDNGYGMFLTMIDYKIAWNGGRLVKINKWFPSSQTCHVCGMVSPITKDLSVRKWVCPYCGSLLDRDINAAINIRIEGHKIVGLPLPNVA